MFGKPEWFLEKRSGWGLKPAKWQGWAYAMVWGFVLCAPFAALLLRNQSGEALIWAVASTMLMLWDVREIRKSKRADTAREDVLYIGDEETDIERLATRTYNLQLRR